MSLKVLSVSILDDSIDILKLEQGIRNSFVAKGEVLRGVDKKSLDKAAGWADRIYINGLFPGAEYRWSEFPDVSNRNLKQLVYRHATQYLETRAKVRVDFADKGKIIVDSLEKRLVSSLAVTEEDVSRIEREVFSKYRHKIHRITSLPVALCNAVVSSERPKDDFMVVWVGEKSLVYAISSPEGDIKVARNIPISMDFDHLDELDMEKVSNEFDRDIMTTLLLYNDNFENPACSSFYLLGNPKLSNIFEKFPLGSVGQYGKYALDHLPVRNLPVKDSWAYYLLGNLFSGNGYNLVDKTITWGQRFDSWYRYAALLLIGCFIFAGTWLLLTAPQSRVSNESFYAEKKEELVKVNEQLYALQQDEIELKRYSGWDNFYKNTYTNQPAWSKLFSSLAAEIPKEFVFSNVEISPGNSKGVHGWQCILTGRIEATEWQTGLNLLRDFGTKFNRSPYADVVDVQYTPMEENRGSNLEETSFDVVIQMILTPQ